MATLVELGGLLAGAARADGSPSDEDQGLGRSYVCSMSSAVDLERPADGNHADLAHSVQRYLSRIVEELHLISAWSSSVYQRTVPVPSPSATEGGKHVDEACFTALARLAVVTDMELLRRDVAKTQHELFQRCTSQMAYVQSESSAAISKLDTLYNELRQRMDDKQRAWEQQSHAVQALEKARAETDAQSRFVTSTLRQVQQQTATHPARLSALEKALAAVATAQFPLEQELQVLQRRVESFETVQQVKLEATRRAAEDSLAGLRSSNAQLAAKMQVLRLEMQELSESTHKRMQQLLKTVSSVAPSTSGKPLLAPAAAAPRRSSLTPRTPRSGGNATASHAPAHPASGTGSDTLDGFLGGGNNAPTVMATGTAAVETTDCFIYAKAALPHRNATADTAPIAKKPAAPSTGSSRMGTSASGANFANQTKPPDAMTNLLTVQQSVMSVPLGCEDSTRPASATESAKDAKPTADRPDPLIPTRRAAHRQKSLPDVNVPMIQGSLSLPSFQRSRLHTKP
jgi:predicted  nucleic acid-binding Zn-ribbon protein